MHPSFLKSKLFTGIALTILTLAFTFPMIGFHGVLNKIDAGKKEEISSFSKMVWNIYNQGRYKSTTTPKTAHNNLDQMIKSSAEIGVASMPIWSVSLEAPNYPKEAFPEGIPVFFHFDGFSGEVHEMNTINHYIGMFPMERGGQIERKLIPFVVLGITLFIIWFNFIKTKISVLFMAPTLILPLGFIIDYSAWLYWFGHNMQNFGAFTIKPFMPTVFGDGKVAQFTTHSYPTIGFFILIVMAILSFMAIKAKLSETQETK